VERNKQLRSFFNPLNGNFYSELSKKHRLGEGATLLQTLEVCDTPMLYLMSMPKGTYHNSASVYPAKADYERVGIAVKAWYGDNAGIVTYAGKRISVNPIGRWFDVVVGDSLSDVVIALNTLEQLLNEHMRVVSEGDFPIYLQETPARSAMDLVRRKLPIGARYESIPGDVEKLLMTNFSQQRSELINHEKTMAEDVHLYDGRFMYASCLRGLPVGEVTHDFISEYLPYVAGFYRVDVTVPMNWKHIGLLPCKNPRQRGKESGSRYPNNPGTFFKSWCSDKELRLALDQGWQCQVSERILWSQTQARKRDIGEDAYKLLGQDPLRAFGESLVRIRQEILPTLTLPTRQKELLSGGLRNMLIHGIGVMHSAVRYGETVYVKAYADIPAHIPDYDRFEGDEGWFYKEPKEKTSYQQAQFQPHWIQYAYSDCKTKVTRFVLEHIPYEQLLAIRTDGVWTTGKVAIPEDTGKIGVFREKELVQRGPFPYPKTYKDIEKLMHVAKGE
jgi:hypothetical protein